MVIPRYLTALIFSLTLAIGLSASHTAIAASPIASIDRSVIAIDDTLTLTIRISDVGSFRGPDLSPLDGLFQVLANSQSSRHTIRNGRAESTTEWVITLMPQRLGQLTIPPLKVNGEQTQAITINVQPSVPVSAGNLQPVFIESEVDNDSVYIQQQIIFTLRVFQSIQLDNMKMSEPDFDNAAVRKLSQNSYQRRIQNTPYQVHELRYAIFPQQAGELIIPELVFSANEAVARRSMFSTLGQGRPLQKMSQQHVIKINKPLATFRGKAWLPASTLTLFESWSNDQHAVRVGDSITRSITVSAEGLIDSQLPPFEFDAIDGAKIYPDQGVAETSLSEQGATAIRIDSAAIIPTREGSIELAEVKLSWWDTRNKKMQQAIIPATTITVKPALVDQSAGSTPLAVDHSQLPTMTSTANTDTSQAFIWQLLSGLLAILWLFTLGMWWQSKQRLQQSSANNNDFMTTPTATQLSERQAFKQLQAQCRSQDIKAIRAAIIHWGESFWPEQTINSLQDIRQICEHPPLTNLLLQLDNQLYGGTSDSSEWNGDSLIIVLRNLRQNRQQKKSNKKDALAPLYK